MEKTFTSEDLALLRKNPYVKSANAQRIRFTVAFKEEFWDRYNRGEIPREIIRSMGIPPEIMGAGRIRGVVKRLKDAAASGTGFTEGYEWQDKNAPAVESHPVSVRLKRLEHELAYMKQELEFVKKITLVDREAERKCLSRQDQRSNSESSEK